MNRTQRLEAVLSDMRSVIEFLTETPYGGQDPTPDELWKGIVRIKDIAESTLKADARRGIKDERTVRDPNSI